MASKAKLPKGVCGKSISGFIRVQLSATKIRRSLHLLPLIDGKNGSELDLKWDDLCRMRSQRGIHC